jgi:hypothetical protein
MPKRSTTKTPTPTPTPSSMLRAYGQIRDQASGNSVPFDPYKITHSLQSTILSYYSNPPKTKDGQTKWLVLLGYRQAGKSLTAELCAYAKTAYTPGMDHVCIADTRDRAEYLHRRVHFTHARWPEKLRTPTSATREVRQLSFDPARGGKMRVMSGESGSVGIGQSPDSFHGSELPFWSDPEGQFSLIYPSMINRDHSLMILESTPLHAGDWWHDQCNDAKAGSGRWVYAFFPFWDGKLNQRPWGRDEKLTLEELRLMDKYGDLGLKRENLAFRRFMMNTDAQIRRDPALFRVFYPFDDLSCWISNHRAIFNEGLLKKHRDRKMEKWSAPYMEYEPPEEGAIYVIGVDPAGHAARDHASFQVLKVYEGEWTQVACYADHTEPILFTRRLLEVAEKYNRAKVVIESNGVGAATIALAKQAEYANLYYEKPYKAGLTSTSKKLEEMIGWLQDALLDELTINDEDTFGQLCSYRHDKRTETSVVSEMLKGSVGPKRRERHHWDKISALQLAVVGARRLPQRPKGTLDKGTEGNVVLFKDLTWNQLQAYRKAEGDDKNKKRSRSRYRSVRRRR